MKKKLFVAVCVINVSFDPNPVFVLEKGRVIFNELFTFIFPWSSFLHDMPFEVAFNNLDLLWRPRGSTTSLRI